MSGTGQIYVRGYAKKTGEQDLKKYFAPFGKIEEIKMLKDFAFVVVMM